MKYEIKEFPEFAGKPTRELLDFLQQNPEYKDRLATEQDRQQDIESGFFEDLSCEDEDIDLVFYMGSLREDERGRTLLASQEWDWECGWVYQYRDINSPWGGSEYVLLKQTLCEEGVMAERERIKRQVIKRGAKRFAKDFEKVFKELSEE